MLVSTWVDNLARPQSSGDDKILFYNSESILNNENILDHFKVDNKKKMIDLNKIEYLCKKGDNHEHNKDNFFVITEGVTKFIGVFDGHGMNGHLASSFTMG
jgi:hypothetical protein